VRLDANCRGVATKPDVVSCAVRKTVDELKRLLIDFPRRPQIDSNVLPEKLLIVLAQVFDFPPAIELFQDSNAANYGESLLAGNAPGIPAPATTTSLQTSVEI
jgi:hypothetical protein